jgi:LmbE family N-acetylglucosaminyl deacetylase
MTEERTLLAILAHPDDEVLATGGTLARYAAEGVRVALVVATRGEAGEIARPGTATPETLPQVREEEMRCSARTLGIDELIFLDYRDSGMEGSPDNEHPDAFINAPAHEVVEQLVRIIRRIRPHVVLTFEPYGGYGHPDHIAANRYTLAACRAAASEERYPRQGQAWQVGRIFYPMIPDSLFREMKERVAAHGGDTSGYDELIEGRRNAPDAISDDEIHLTLDVAAYVEQKWQSWECHRSQFGPNSRFRRLPDEEMKELLSKEYYTLARPEPQNALQLDDLFDGLP